MITGEEWQGAGAREVVGAQARRWDCGTGVEAGGGQWAWPGLPKADPEPHTGPLACVWRAPLLGQPAAS